MGLSWALRGEEMELKDIVGFVAFNSRMAPIMGVLQRGLRTRISHRTAVAGLALAALSAACSQGVVRRMFPTPIVMQDERLDFSRAVLPEHRATEVSVLFATRRAPAPPGAPERYARGTNDAVRVGVARVQLGEPGWSF